MAKISIRFLKLIVGLFLYALGIVLTIQANIGYGPWEVFHVGISAVTGISIGTASIIVGLVIVLITILMGETIGLGTLLNMFLIGFFLDLLLALGLIPKVENLLAGIPVLILGLYVISLGSYFYIGSGFGAGPRDSLMVALARRLRWPIGLIRSLIELTATILGWTLGGMVGLGTLISGFAIGFCIHSSFKLLKFDPTRVHHSTLNESLAELKAALVKKGP
ncbi:MAG: hypothetical protein RBT72_00140 [Spirochaetia bacterium]|jgi:uncharacterized membrane protein YczE|nr:hypothetical protein [Spirochaetales bacterium]MDX9783149.1 hypothetical protein [Spirochaetia bacterium]